MDRMQSVFDNATELEKEFDNMFEAEDEDEILSIVQGVKEDGSELPDFNELHQVEDAETVKDMEKELGPDHDTDNKPTADSNGDFEIDDEGLDLACPTTGVADAVTKTEPDPEDIDGESEKAADKIEKEFNEAYQSLMEDFGIEEDDMGLDKDSDQQDQLENNEDTKEDMREPVKQEGSNDPGVEENIDDDVTDTDTTKVGSDIEPTKTEGSENYTDDIEDEIEDEEDFEDGSGDIEESSEKTDESGEDSDVNNESADLTEEIEDEIIDNIESEDNETASEADVKSLENVDDDDIIDGILEED